MSSIRHLTFALALLTPAPALAQGTLAEQNWSWYRFESRPPFVGAGIEDPDDGDLVWAGNAVFRPGAPPEVPVELRRPDAKGDVFAPGWFLVHIEGGVTDEHREWLDLLSGRIERVDGTPLARWYVPDDTLAAWVEQPGVLAALEAMPDVDFVGRYEPAYKLDPSIGSARFASHERAARSYFRLNVDVIPGHPIEAVAGELAMLGLVVLEQVVVESEAGYDVRFLVVDALPQNLEQIAHVEGVRMIQEAGEEMVTWDLSGGGKLQNRTLAVDDEASSPIVGAGAFPLWITHDLQGQGQMIGVVDTALDWANVGTLTCDSGYPDTAIQNWGFADPILPLKASPTTGPTLKVPRVRELGGATLQGATVGEHGCAVAGAALADFYGNDASKHWEHDFDDPGGGAAFDNRGLMGPGIAHEAQLFFVPVCSNGLFKWELPGEFETNMGKALTSFANQGACTSVHSVGIVEGMNRYSQTSVVHDTEAFDHPYLLQVIAAGNCGETAQPAFCGNEAKQLTSQAVVKNALTVGASDDVLAPEDRAPFSSAGFTFDNRIKPDILAPGTDLALRDSTISQLVLPDNNGISTTGCLFQQTSGTSFAAPIAAGAAALVHQYFEEGRYLGNTTLTDASAALLKACLINAGTRLTGNNLGDGTYPNEQQGWGEPNLESVLEFAGDARHLIVVDQPSDKGFKNMNAVPKTYAFTVDSSLEDLRVTLVWTDEPGSTGTGKQLVNDLHLELLPPTGPLFKGNEIDGTLGYSQSGGGFDKRNNVENVLVQNPAVGTWRARVDPSKGNYGTKQGFALVITGDVTETSNPERYYFTFDSTTAVPGKGKARDEDIVCYDRATNSWSRYFDGSDVGLSDTALNAIHVRPNGDILFSISDKVFEIPGLIGGPGGKIKVRRNDIVLFQPTSTGAATAGTFTFFFDGSDVGLTTAGENIDGIYEFANGDLALSFTGSVDAQGLTAKDEDVLLFDPTSTGEATAGTFSRLVDGSDLELSNSAEDLDAVTFDRDEELLFSTEGAWSVAEGKGADEDLGWFEGTFGPATSGTVSKKLDLSGKGIDGSADVNGMSLWLP